MKVRKLFATVLAAGVVLALSGAAGGDVILVPGIGALPGGDLTDPQNNISDGVPDPYDGTGYDWVAALFNIETWFWPGELEHSGYSFAYDGTFTSIDDGYWHKARTWGNPSAPPNVPTSDSEVIIDGETVTVRNGHTNEAMDLTITDGMLIVDFHAALAIGGNVTVASPGGLDIRGTLSAGNITSDTVTGISGGTLITGGVSLADLAITDSGTIENSGALSAGNLVLAADSTFTKSGAGKLSFTRGDNTVPTTSVVRIVEGELFMQQLGATNPMDEGSLHLAGGTFSVQAQALAALDMTATDVSVTADSAINAITDYTADFGILTFNEPGILTTTGAPDGISFAGTNIRTTGPVGFNTETDTWTGPIDGGWYQATIIKTGPADLILDAPAMKLEGSVFDVQEGRLIASRLAGDEPEPITPPLPRPTHEPGGSAWGWWGWEGDTPPGRKKDVEPDPSPNPLGHAGVQLSGGELALTTSVATTQTAPGTFSNPLYVIADSSLTAGQHAGGLGGPQYVQLGNDVNGVTIQTGKTLSIGTTDVYTLRLAGRVEGGNVLVKDGTVEISAGGTLDNLEIPDTSTGELTVQNVPIEIRQSGSLTLGNTRFEATVGQFHAIGTLTKTIADNIILSGGTVTVKEAPLLMVGALGYSSDEGSGSVLNFDSSDYVDIPAAKAALASLAGTQKVSISLLQYGDEGAESRQIVIFQGTDDGRQIAVHLPWGNSNAYGDAFQNAGDSQFEDQWNHWVLVDTVVADPATGDGPINMLDAHFSLIYDALSMLDLDDATTALFGDILTTEEADQGDEPSAGIEMEGDFYTALDLTTVEWNKPNVHFSLIDDTFTILDLGGATTAVFGDILMTQRVNHATNPKAWIQITGDHYYSAVNSLALEWEKLWYVRRISSSPGDWVTLEVVPEPGTLVLLGLGGLGMFMRWTRRRV